MENLGSNVEGVYLLGRNIGGKPSWKHANGDYIIWWCDLVHIRWCIFEKREVSSILTRCILKTTDEVSRPHEATNWIYYNRTTNVGLIETMATDRIHDGIRTTDVTISNFRFYVCI